MRRLSAQYIFTNDGPPLKRGIIETDDDGTVLSVTDTGGNPPEMESLEFYNGILIPGFVNCHCHLELSHMKGLIPEKSGLAQFLSLFRSGRDADTAIIKHYASVTDDDMFRDGTLLCADICNTTNTFEIKKNSRIKYINLLEVFGIDPGKAGRRIDEIKAIAGIAASQGMAYSIVPHAAYSISLTLFRLLHAETISNRITSMHFMETRAEKQFLENHEGPLMDSYIESELISGTPETVRDHAAAILEEVTPSGNLIVVHNTFADMETIKKVSQRKNLYWCLCPNANLYIEDQLPPVRQLMEEKCNLVIGTDSLASNSRLSIIEELKTLQINFPDITLAEMIRWATINGAMALGDDDLYGSIRPGKKPGLLLVRELDLQELKLLPGSYVSRLV